MAALDIGEMAPEEEYFVSTCSHVNESEEIDRCGQRRLEWMRAMRAQGLRVTKLTPQKLPRLNRWDRH